MALTATAGLLGSQLIVGIIALFNPSYQEKTWHLFLIYLAYAIAETIVNSFGNSALPLINKTAISWSITGFVVISITVLAVASPNYNSADFVFRLFVNETGWPDGLAWLLGLLQGGLALTGKSPKNAKAEASEAPRDRCPRHSANPRTLLHIGYDATVHMVEEIPDATIVAPKILLYCVLIGMFTGFIFNMCLLFVAPSLQHTISSPYGPLGQILYTATSSKAGTVCLLIFPLVCLMFAGISIMTTSSRMAYAFARDGGLPFSKLLARVHPRLDVPLESIALTFIVVVVFGLIDLGSSAAFNAIISASVVALGLSYGIPVTINVLRGRKMLPASRPFKMPEWLAWPANLLGIAYVLITTVLFVFPPAIPVSGTSMNYCIVAFAIVLLISMITWFVDGRKNYKGPKIWIDPSMLTAEQSAEIEGVGSNGQFESDEPEEKSKKM